MALAISKPSRLTCCHSLPLVAFMGSMMMFVSGSSLVKWPSIGFLWRILKVAVRVNLDLLCGSFRFHGYVSIFKLFISPCMNCFGTHSEDFCFSPYLMLAHSKEILWACFQDVWLLVFWANAGSLVRVSG